MRLVIAVARTRTLPMPEKRIEKSLYQFADIRLVCYRESPGLLSRPKGLVSQREEAAASINF